VNYFAVGHSSECFSFIKDWVEKKVRRHLAGAQKRRGFGWERWSRPWLYNILKLFNGYRVRRDGPKVVLLQRLELIASDLREGSAHLSGGNLEQFGDELRLGLDVVAADVPNLPLPHHCHRLVACQRSSGRPKATKAKPGPGQPFHAPMVLLHDIVQVFHLSQP